MKPTELTTSVWAVDDADFPRDAAIDEQIRFLLNYAILAPSSHNSQPWRFAVRDGRVEVRPEEDRTSASSSSASVVPSKISASRPITSGSTIGSTIERRRTMASFQS